MVVLKLPDLALRVQIPGAEGLLLRIRDLIERGRLDVGQVRIAAVAGWMLRLKRHDPDASVADLCATLEAFTRLMLLKARRMAGMWEPAAEEDAPPWLGPPPELPLRRSWLAERIAAGPLAFVGRAQQYDEVSPQLMPIAPDGLRAAMLAMLGRQRPPTPVVAPTLARVPVGRYTNRILEALARDGEATWRQVSDASRDAHVAAFLACLALARQGRVQLTQDEPFGDIVVRPASEALEATA